jgi:GNAT superfamily N-acetyltransferase
VTNDLVVTRHGSDEALSLRDEILPVYAAAEAAQMGNPWFRPEKFWERLETMYAPGRGFELVAGRLDGVLVGYAFGSPIARSEDIWKAVAANLPNIPAADTSAPVFIFREFQVHPDHQGRGYGRALHDALLASRPERLAHLSVRPDNVRARGAYFSWGWRKLGEHRPYPDWPVFETLVRELPLHSA